MNFVFFVARLTEEFRSNGCSIGTDRDDGGGAELVAAFRNRKGEFVPFGDGEYLRLTSALVKRLEALDSAGRLKGKALEVPPAAIPMLDGAFSDGDKALPLPASMAERADAIRAVFAKKVEPPPARPWRTASRSCGASASS